MPLGGLTEARSPDRRAAPARLVERRREPAEGGVAQDLLDRYGQLAPPIGVLLRGAGQVDLLDLAHGVLDLDEDEARVGPAEVAMGRLAELGAKFRRAVGQ